MSNSHEAWSAEVEAVPEAYRNDPEVIKVFGGGNTLRQKVGGWLLYVAEEVSAAFDKGQGPPEYLIHDVINWIFPAIRDKSPKAKWISVEGPTRILERAEFFDRFTEPQLRLRYAMLIRYQLKVQEGLSALSGARLFYQQKFFFKEPRPAKRQNE